MRQLLVSIDETLVGTLSESDDLWRFDYDRTWVEAARGFDLSPGLPRAARQIVDGSTHRPVQWYFDNLLPEELLREAICKEAGLRGEDAFALLEYLGAESAGSLTLLAPGAERATPGGLRPLTDEALSARIGRLPRSTLTEQAPKRMSLAGAQHKLLVVKSDGQLFEPVGATPSTHILKPRHPGAAEYPGSVTNEYVTMRLADACGLRVPAVDVRFVPEPVYIVDRFDRVIQTTAQAKRETAERVVSRRHIIDACQLLNRPRGFKHVGATLQSLLEVIEQSTNKVDTRLRLFRWLVFNVAVANDDCHLKNISFFVDAQGIQLAPHYDLLATSVWNTRTFADEKENWPRGLMGFELPSAKRFADVTPASIFEAGEALGVPRIPAARIVQEVVTRLPAAIGAEAESLESRRASAPEGAKRFLAAEAKAFHVMRAIVIPEMLKRLKAL